MSRIKPGRSMVPEFHRSHKPSSEDSSVPCSNRAVPIVSGRTLLVTVRRAWQTMYDLLHSEFTEGY